MRADDSRSGVGDYCAPDSARDSFVASYRPPSWSRVTVRGHLGRKERRLADPEGNVSADLPQVRITRSSNLGMPPSSISGEVQPSMACAAWPRLPASRIRYLTSSRPPWLTAGGLAASASVGIKPDRSQMEAPVANRSRSGRFLPALASEATSSVSFRTGRPMFGAKDKATAFIGLCFTSVISRSSTRQERQCPIRSRSSSYLLLGSWPRATRRGRRSSSALRHLDRRVAGGGPGELGSQPVARHDRESKHYRGGRSVLAATRDERVADAHRERDGLAWCWPRQMA
jgi:hypothetical protein